METLMPIIIQAVSGIVGAGVAGTVVKAAAMANLPRILSGAVGGVAGGTLIASLLGGGAVDPVATAEAATAASGLDIGALLGQVLGGAVGGGALTALIGAVTGDGRR